MAPPCDSLVTWRGLWSSHAISKQKCLTSCLCWSTTLNMIFSVSYCSDGPRRTPGSVTIHLKLRNINLHNVTHSLISRNPREWMFVVQFSFLIVTFLSFISWILSLMQTTKEVNPHPRIAPCVNMWSVTFLFLLFFFLCHLLNVGSCPRHIDREGQVEWTTLA